MAYADRVNYLLGKIITAISGLEHDNKRVTTLLKKYEKVYESIPDREYDPHPTLLFTRIDACLQYIEDNQTQLGPPNKVYRVVVALVQLRKLFEEFFGYDDD